MEGRYLVSSAGLVSTLVRSGQNKSQSLWLFVVNQDTGFRGETFIKIDTSRMIAIIHTTINRAKRLTMRSNQEITQKKWAAAWFTGKQTSHN
jgi:hypothetical protein